MTKLQIAFGVVVGIAATIGLFGVVDYPSYVQIPFVSFFVAIWLFTGGIHAKQMVEKGEIDQLLLWVYSPLVMTVILVDVFFNLTWGTIIYRELPREFLFTTRTKRHIGDSAGRNYLAARRWAFRLNAIDPGHV
jgi:hypothetical protein